MSGLTLRAVSVSDETGAPIAGVVTNGSLIGTLDGWTANEPPPSSTNFTGPARVLRGLTTTRSFFAIPSRPWARFVDVFENQTANEISATIRYTTDVGSDDKGVMYDPTGGNQALIGYDLDLSDRDVGVVYGDGVVTFASASGSRASLDDDFTVVDGSEIITVDYPVVIAPGGRVAIANFLLLGLDNAAADSLDDSARSDLDAAAADVLTHYGDDGDYRAGLTQEQIDAIINF